ncbi:MAG: endopeptidase La [Lachnospiraceae bacterium]
MSDSQKIKMVSVALRGTCVLPGMIAHFDLIRQRSVNAVEKAMAEDRTAFFVSQKDPSVEEPTDDDLYRIGTVCRIKQVMKMQKGMLRILIEGVEKAEITGIVKEDEYLEMEVSTFDRDGIEDEDEYTLIAMKRDMKNLFMAFCQISGNFSTEVADKISECEDIRELMDEIAINLPVGYEKKQEMLENITIREKYEYFYKFLDNEIRIIEAGRELQKLIKQQLDKNQKEYVLREQLKIIRQELGDDDPNAQIDKYKNEVASLTAGDEVKEKILEEIDKFKNISPSSSEGAVMRGYIETLISMPWDKRSEDNNDIVHAKEILDRDHYGLDKVKERIIEFLAVRQLAKDETSPILCLVGPPGTGKTSIGKSVAEALDKKYQRIALGGVKDEAEIRGHRRTYVGAMPGRIAAVIKNSGVKNPLIVLDEVDKVGADYKGDVSSALLEVLDPEQNKYFSDHYIDIPIDLSEVLFIATANDAQSIPRPLLDRMEIIEISGYTDNEKLHIAREHLIPKQMRVNGIIDKNVKITDSAANGIIMNYTREAGVRQLERVIGKVCRKCARTILEEKRRRITVTEKNLKNYLGNVIFTHDHANEKNEIGIARGLAWTSVGGETLEIEVNIMPGKGEFVLTGQLGDVMKESAMTGISYIRSVAEKYEIEDDYFKKKDFHIHIPEGAVPKDGPSAGITMAVAMLSAIISKPVRADVAMTGEITLRGRVLPVGGLKEKLLAASKAGVTTVVVPAENKRNISEIDEEITSGLKIVYAGTMEQVIKTAFVQG